MTYQNGNHRPLLSILWVFIILNFFARDIHELGRPGILEQMMSGTVDGVVITEVLMLFGGIMIEIPILMTVLALLLPYRNRGMVLRSASAMAKGFCREPKQTRTAIFATGRSCGHAFKS